MGASPSWSTPKARHSAFTTASLTWAGNQVTGAAAYDTSTVSGPGGFTPTGTVTYSFYSSGSCTGTPISADEVGLSSGIIPPSATTSPLPSGAYGFLASYSGDANYGGSTSRCEAFSVISRPVISLPLLVVTAPSLSIYYGSVLPVLVPTYAGFVGGDSASSLTSPATCSTTAAYTSPPGSYPVTCSGASALSYVTTYVAGTLTMLPTRVAPEQPTPRASSAGRLLAVTPAGTGWWVLNRDGTVSAEGTAPKCTRTAGQQGNGPIAAIAAARDGEGYWLVTSGGTVSAFGDAHLYAPESGRDRSRRGDRRDHLHP